MNSSPTTPGGQGRKDPSRTYTCVFQIGTPIGTGLDPPVQSQAVESTDVSVGPYRLCSSAPHTCAKR